MSKTREEVYDDEIRPLMARIFGVCKKYDIPLVATFQIDARADGEEAVFRSSAVNVDSARVAGNVTKAFEITRPKPAWWSAYIVDADGGSDMTDDE